MAQTTVLQRLMRGFALMTVLALVGMLLLACGEEEDVANGGNTGSNGNGSPTAEPSPTNPPPPPASPTTTPDRIDHPTGADDVIVKIEHAGGFVMPETLMTRLPLFVLFGDGCYIVQGPMIEIYPQPALPNLQETCLNEEGVQEILAKAKAAGLLDGDAQYDNDMIADAATTVFTVTAGGQTSTVRAYALELDPMLGPNVDEPLAEAREKLATFRDEVTDIESWIAPNMIVEPAHDYEIERMQIAILPADSPSAPQIEEGLEAQTIDWPLMTPLSSFGTPYFTDEYRCGVVEGEDLATLLPLLREANQLTRWVSTDETTGEEEEYIFFLRPLFPGEQPCTAPAF